ncbi:MAG: hypothetical protein J0H67_16255 [Rhodospirillales bacterium]|nr:hypothetical protein [Rhodospirillales bacterium]
MINAAPADLRSAAARLAAVLARENAALAALDLAAVAALLPEKQAAAAAFAEARGAAEAQPPLPALRPVADQLLQLGAENRRLLERAMAVQTRVMGLVARALPVSTAPGYAAPGVGAPGAARRPIAFALSARA